MLWATLVIYRAEDSEAEDWDLDADQNVHIGIPEEHVEQVVKSLPFPTAHYTRGRLESHFKEASGA